MSVESFTPTALQFTQGAASKVKNLVSEEGNARLKLRVFVTGGGNIAPTKVCYYANLGQLGQ
ncbi:Iron-sulfur cluster insertion protein ErpA [compost metagenome]